jgi:hypothetical protein
MEDRKRPAIGGSDDLAPPSKRVAVNGSKVKDDALEMKEETWIDVSLSHDPLPLAHHRLDRTESLDALPVFTLPSCTICVPLCSCIGVACILSHNGLGGYRCWTMMLTKPVMVLVALRQQSTAARNLHTSLGSLRFAYNP